MAHRGYIARRGLVGVIALLGLVSAPAWAETRAGLVTAVNGDANAQSKQNKRPLAINGPVFIGDRVATGDGARATLLLGRATDLRLGEKARLIIDRFIVDAGGTVTLGSGALLLDPTPGSGTGAIRAPHSMG